MYTTTKSAINTITTTNIKVITGNSSTGEYYALKNSGDIYKYTIVRDDKTRQERITTITKSFDKKDYGNSKIKN